MAASIRLNRKYSTRPFGSTSVFISATRFKEVHIVCEEGLFMNIVDGVIPTPGSGQVQFLGSFGIFRFDSPAPIGGLRFYVEYEP